MSTLVGGVWIRRKFIQRGKKMTGEDLNEG